MSKKASKKDAQLSREIFEFLEQAIKHARDNGIPKTHLALWLAKKGIAFKNIVVNKEFVPHIEVEYKDGDKIKEFIFDLTKLENRSAEEIMNEVQGVKDATENKAE